ncbi:MAG: pinensin family lanthipeptide [Cyclobacteriaceae bacterium]
MAKRKLNLDELRVESFVTSFEADHDGTVKGGANPSWVDACQSALIACGPIVLKTINGCFKTMACPSAVDACPSAPGGCTFDPGTIQTLTGPIREF